MLPFTHSGSLRISARVHEGPGGGTAGAMTRGEGMSDQDKVDDVLERLEWDDARREERPDSKLWAATRRTALTAGAAGIAALALEACGGGKGANTPPPDPTAAPAGAGAAA